MPVVNSFSLQVINDLGTRAVYKANALGNTIWRGRLLLNGSQLLNGWSGRVHHAHVREQTNKIKCSLKVSGKDDHTGSQQTMIDEQYMMVCGENGRSVQLVQEEMAV